MFVGGRYDMHVSNYMTRHFKNNATTLGTPKMSRKIGNSSPTEYPAFATPTHMFAPAIPNQSTTNITVAT
jgi:hypothetical protein